MREAESRYFALREGRRQTPMTDGDRRSWSRFLQLEDLLFKGDPGNYARSKAVWAEVTRLRSKLAEINDVHGRVVRIYA